DRVRGGGRRAAGHPRGPLGAGHRADPGHRPVDLVAVPAGPADRPGSGRPGGGGAGADPLSAVGSSADPGRRPAGVAPTRRRPARWGLIAPRRARSMLAGPGLYSGPGPIVLRRLVLPRG